MAVPSPARQRGYDAGMKTDRCAGGFVWSAVFAALLGCGEPVAPAPTTDPLAAPVAPAPSDDAEGPVSIATIDAETPSLDACGALSESNDRCGPVLSLDPEVPGDACDPGLDGWTPSANAMDHFSWRTLVALLWPATPDVAGLPDRSSRIGDRSTETLSRPAVFETWPSPDDLRALDAQLEEGDRLRPDDWGKTPPAPGACPGETGLRVLRHTSKVRPETAAALTGPPASAHGGPAVDQNGQIVFVETRFNRTVWDVITGGGFNRPGADRRGLDYPNNLGDTGYEQGAVAVQAAWRVLSTDEAASGEYHVSEVLLFQEGTSERQAVCDRTTVGLVGLSIAHNTAWGGDDWVWSVFDHASTTANPGGARTDGFFLSSSSCGGADPRACASAPVPAGESLACCPNTDLHGPLGPAERIIEDRTPTQVTRTTPADDRSGCGEQYRTALRGTPVEFMQLGGTQWWANPEAETLELGPEPRTVRSLTMQPFAVEFDADGTQRTDSSCIGCHRQGEDRLFLLSASKQAPPESPGTASPSEEPSAPE